MASRVDQNPLLFSQGWEGSRAVWAGLYDGDLCFPSQSLCWNWMSTLLDVLDTRTRVHFELATPFTQQKLNGGEVTFVQSQAANKLGSVRKRVRPLSAHSVHPSTWA